MNEKDWKDFGGKGYLNQKKSLALYVHIPFCIKKCLYCDFLSGKASPETQQEYIVRLQEELRYWREKVSDSYEVKTIFIGGGTPTVLTGKMLSQLGEAIFSCFSVAGDAEFTVEANPGTVTEESVRAFREMQVNRVSLGLQSVHDPELRALGRIHTYADFLKSYQMLREAGFQNINIDLMADIPLQTMESYAHTLDTVCALQPEHISSYSLIVEEGTPFAKLQEEGKLILPDEEADRTMYAMTEEVLEHQGYHRYEISNYAKDGMECRHNLTYWEMGEYLGVGLGSSSYFDGCRFKNTEMLKDYLTKPFEQTTALEKHVLTRNEEVEEFLFLGLRKTDGISMRVFQERFGVEIDVYYQKIMEKLLKERLLEKDAAQDRIRLTKKGIDVSNLVLAEFLL